MLTRVGVLAIVGLIGLAALLPRAGAHDGGNEATLVASDPALLYPAPLSGEPFGRFYSGGPVKNLRSVRRLLNGG